MPKGTEKKPNGLATVDRGAVLERAQTLDPAIIEKLVIGGDLKSLNPVQKVQYYQHRCHQAGLDPSTQPFSLISFQGKEVLYANKSATEGLIQARKLNVAVLTRGQEETAYVVCVRVTNPDGRFTDNLGASSLIYPEKIKDPSGGWKDHPKAGKMMTGDDYGNSVMRAITKASRRGVLGHCGLGEMDETEVATIPGATVIPMDAPTVTVAHAWTEDEVMEAHKVAEMIFELSKEAYLSEALAERGKQKYMNLMGQVSFLEWMQKAEASLITIRKQLDEMKPKVVEPEVIL